MTTVELAPHVADDFDRILAHLAEHAVNDTEAPALAIIDAISALERNPLLGRPTAAEHRELVIGRRARGYLALYRYVSAIDTAFVLGVRSQREAGYAH